MITISIMANITDYIRGDTRVIQINCVQSDGTTPLDITGATVKFTLSTSTDPAQADTPSLQKTQTTHTAPSLGQTAITINPADTASLAAGTYHYDVELTDASSNKTSLKQGIFKINADITR